MYKEDIQPQNIFLILGMTRIAILNANLRSVPAKDRFKGYQMAMMDAHKSLNERLIRKTKSEYLDGFTRENGYEMMKELLKPWIGKTDSSICSE